MQFQSICCSGRQFGDARVPVSGLVTNPDSAFGPTRRSPFAMVPAGSTQYVHRSGTAYTLDPHSAGSDWQWLQGKKFLNDGRLVSALGASDSGSAMRSVIWGGILSGAVIGGAVASLSAKRKAGVIAGSAAVGAISLGLLSSLATKIVDYANASR